MSCLSSETYSNLKRRKFLIFLIAAMIALFLLLFFINLSYSKELPCTHSQRNDEVHELKLLHVFFRHGARTPADTYPNDIYVNESFSPYGWGQLTNVGRNQIFELGGFLRHRYGQFLGETLNLNEIHAQCTDVSRTKMSLQLVLASLFPPKNTPLEWNTNLNWQPIPFNYEELTKDSLLLVRLGCPRYHEELERVMREDVGEEIKFYGNMMRKLTNITGSKIETPDDVQSLYNTLKTEQEYGLELAKWTKEFYPEPLKNFTDRSFVFNSYNSILKRLKGGVFLKKAISDYQSKIDAKSQKKIFIYAGHDSTIANIFSALNVWEGQHPDYAITGLLEFSKHKETGEYGVEVFIRQHKNLTQLTIPGCEKFCELSKLQKLLSDNIPKNFDDECKPQDVNFSTPPPHGP